MAAAFHPREAVQGLLRGVAPERPLFLPVVFALGARMSNLPLQEYLGNPTKITAALRQISGNLRADAVTCYYDPWLEVEALGAELKWNGDGSEPEMSWPHASAAGELPEGLRSPEEAATHGRVPIAAEVIRRMKATAGSGRVLLMAGVTGPLTLATLLAPSGDTPTGGTAPSPLAAELAGQTTGAVARALCEAGAEVVLIRERMAPPGEAAAEAMAQLEATINIVRFYEALPLVLFTGRDLPAPPSEMTGPDPGCVFCFTLRPSIYREQSAGFARANFTWGLALPADALSGDENCFSQFEQGLQRVVHWAHPAVVTSSGDITDASNVKRLAGMATTLAQSHSQSH